MNPRKKIDKAILSIREELIDKGIVKNKSEFADKLASYTGILSGIEKGTRMTSIDMIIRLFENFGEFISPNKLFGFDEIEDNISFMIDANAGASVSVNIQDSNIKFRIPDLLGDYLAFRVKGDSMYPTLENNDILICEEISEISDVKSGKIYVINSNDGVNVKRIELEKNESDIMGITLISDNLEYSPMSVDFSDGIHNLPFYNIYSPIRRITRNGIL